MSKRVTLSLSKLDDFLKGAGYIFVSTYCTEEGECKFVEVKTPALQKNFVIHIPDKFFLTVEDKDKKRFYLSSTQEMPRKQLDYMMELKGPLLECDLVCVSSEFLYLYRHNGYTETYVLRDEEKKNTTQQIQTEDTEDDEDVVSRLVSNTNKIIKKVDPTNTLIIDTAVKKKEVEENVELTFESDEIMSKNKSNKDDATLKNKDVSASKNKSEKDEKEQTKNSPMDGKKKKKKVKVELEFQDTPKKKRERNVFGDQIPDRIEEGGIVIGITYISVELAKFFKEAASLENDIVSDYDSLNDNEEEIRVANLTKITEKTAQLMLRAKARLDEISKEEDALRKQLSLLSKVSITTKTMLEKSDLDAKNRKEMESISEQTKTTINEINLELHRLRDVANDLILNYDMTLSDLLDL
jgi:hypothetical protein